MNLEGNFRGIIDILSWQLRELKRIAKNFSLNSRCSG
jgi:hypothetical protein